MLHPSEPGPELDAAVAKAIGRSCLFHSWERTGECNHYGSVFQCRNCKDICLNDGPPVVESCFPPYSTDANAALEAAEAVGLFDNWLIGKCKDGWYFQDHSERGMPGFKDQPSFALAICLAILESRNGKA